MHSLTGGFVPDMSVTSTWVAFSFSVIVSRRDASVICAIAGIWGSCRCRTLGWRGDERLIRYAGTVRGVKQPARYELIRRRRLSTVFLQPQLA